MVLLHYNINVACNFNCGLSVQTHFDIKLVNLVSFKFMLCIQDLCFTQIDLLQVLEMHNFFPISLIICVEMGLIVIVEIIR